MNVHCNPAIRTRVDREKKFSRRAEAQSHNGGAMKPADDREGCERCRFPHVDVGVLSNLARRRHVPKATVSEDTTT